MASVSLEAESAGILGNPMDAATVQPDSLGRREHRLQVGPKSAPLAESSHSPISVKGEYERLFRIPSKTGRWERTEPNSPGATRRHEGRNHENP
jgi:hypothetical protein